MKTPLHKQLADTRVEAARIRRLRDRRIIAWYKRGWRISDLAHENGLSRQRVEQIVNAIKKLKL